MLVTSCEVYSVYGGGSVECWRISPHVYIVQYVCISYVGLSYFNIRSTLCTVYSYLRTFLYLS